MKHKIYTNFYIRFSSHYSDHDHAENQDIYWMTAFSKALFGICLLTMPWLVLAEETVPESSVENTIRSMDKDSDGMVTVYEVRVLIEAKHGKDYKKDALDRLEATAKGTSCTTSFAKPMY
mgnify:CR=1 FL=1